MASAWVSRGPRAARTGSSSPSGKLAFVLALRPLAVLAAMPGAPASPRVSAAKIKAATARWRSLLGLDWDNLNMVASPVSGAHCAHASTGSGLRDTALVPLLRSPNPHTETLNLGRVPRTDGNDFSDKKEQTVRKSRAGPKKTTDPTSCEVGLAGM